MDFGAVFPQTEFGHDPVAVRDYAQTVEGLGYTHVVAYDHVLGANPDRPGGWSGAYTHESSFLEPFVLFAHMAAVTRAVGYLTGILILPQRQTALVAKQAATLDVLCGGRLRVGAGLGWNEVEYVALGEDFHTRGRRLDEQIAVLRQLWTQPLVQFAGRWHTIPDAGLNPLPAQRPIPIWLGGQAPEALRRMVKLADGWLPNAPGVEQARPALDLIERYCAELGRDRATVPIEPRLPYGDGNPDTWRARVRDWRAVGATQFCVNTMRAGFTTPAAHVDALRKFIATDFAD